LHQKSYDLHRELAQRLPLESFREIPTLSLGIGRQKNINPLTQWLGSQVTSSLMDSITAQVTPYELTTKLIEASKAEVIFGDVDLIYENSEVCGVNVTNYGSLLCDKLVLAMGPWTGVALEDWFGLFCPMEGIKSSSIIYSPCAQDVRMVNEPYACFCDEDENDCHLEIYPRPNGEVYVCGLGGSDHISGDQLRAGGEFDSSEKVVANESRIAAARSSLNKLTTSLSLDRSPEIVQACMRPLTADGLPVMGAVPNQHDRVFVCAGHNCWGILWAPISGLAMSELLLDGQCNVLDLTPFQPDRFLSKKRKVGKGIQERYGRKNGEEAVGEQWNSTTTLY
jgi:glycine/D-amino acid oxidase-like deaminating enzyme